MKDYFRGYTLDIDFLSYSLFVNKKSQDVIG
jgi:hypothetical protein